MADSDNPELPNSQGAAEPARGARRATPPEGIEQQKGRFVSWLFGDESTESGQIPGAEGEEEPSALAVGNRLYMTLADINRRLNLLNDRVAGGGDQRDLLSAVQRGHEALGKNQETIVRRLDRLYEAIRLVAAELRQLVVVTQQGPQQPTSPTPAGTRVTPPPMPAVGSVGRASPTGPPEAFLKDPAHIKARRVANAMVSDLEAYNRQKLEDSIREGTTVKIMEKGIADMRAAYDRRVPERVREEYDYLSEAIIELFRRKRRELVQTEAAPPGTPDAQFEAQVMAGSSQAAGRTPTPSPAPSPAAAPPMSTNVVLSGRIVGSLLIDMIQLQSQNNETGVLHVIPDTGDAIDVYFVSGAIYNCVASGAEGEKAFFEALQVAEGHFEFERVDNTNIERKIEHETSFLIVEALRRIDENALNAP
jgi:hypothetical protein